MRWVDLAIAGLKAVGEGVQAWALKTFRPRTWQRRENDHRTRVWRADCRDAFDRGDPPPPPPNKVWLR